MKSIDLFNKCFVVTGAGRGLGRSLAEHLIRKEQARVIAVDIRIDLLEELKQEMEQFTPGSIQIIQADLSRSDEVDNVFTTSIAMSCVFGIINNAGITHFGPADCGKIDLYTRIMDINYIAAMKLTLLFREYFLLQEKGCILNISSLGGLIPMAYQTAYSASKHAIQSFTEAIIEETICPEITICTYAPGGIATSMVEEAGLSQHFKGKNVRLLTPTLVADKAIRNLKKGRSFGTTSFTDHLFVFGIRLLPRAFTRKIISRIYQPRKEKNKKPNVFQFSY